MEKFSKEAAERIETSLLLRSLATTSKVRKFNVELKFGRAVSGECKTLFGKEFGVKSFDGWITKFVIIWQISSHLMETPLDQLRCQIGSRYQLVPSWYYQLGNRLVYGWIEFLFLMQIRCFANDSDACSIKCPRREEGLNPRDFFRSLWSFSTTKR